MVRTLSNHVIRFIEQNGQPASVHTCNLHTTYSQ